MGVRDLHGVCGARVRVPVRVPAGDEGPQHRRDPGAPILWLLPPQARELASAQQAARERPAHGADGLTRVIHPSSARIELP